jgi:hypothetical protein
MRSNVELFRSMYHVCSINRGIMHEFVLLRTNKRPVPTYWGPRTVPVVKNSKWLWGHAVNTPVRVAVVIAYRDGEASIVGTYQVNQLSLLALDLQCLSLAGICCVVARLFCNTKQIGLDCGPHQCHTNTHVIPRNKNDLACTTIGITKRYTGQNGL